MKPFTRLKAECIFTTGAAELEQRLDRIDRLLDTKSTREALKEMQQTLALLKKDHEDHVTKYTQNYLMSMLEIQKLRQINPLGAPPLQTNGWNSGDLKRLREPAPPKKKDEKKSKRGKKKQ